MTSLRRLTLTKPFGFKALLSSAAIGAASLMALSTSASADYEDALAAFNNDNFEYAEDLWFKYATAGDIRSKLALGDLYSRTSKTSSVTVDPNQELPGADAIIDSIEGLAWYILAANHDFDSYQQRELSFEEVNAKIKAQERVLEMNDRMKDKDISKAHKRVAEILSSGSTFDLYRLGRMYQAGAGLEKDNVKALQYFTLANMRSPRNNSEASDRAEYLREIMPSKDVKKSQKAADEWVAPTPHQEDSPRQLELKAQIAELQLLRSEEALKNIEPEFKNNDHLIQSALSALGYRPGKVDGRIGPDTRDAIRRFQADLQGKKKKKTEDQESEPAEAGSAADTVAKFMKPCSDVEITGVLAACQKVKLIEKAAKEGHPRSQYVFGLMHANGIGMSVDGAKALEHLEAASSYGSALAHNALGKAYRDGIGGDKPLRKNRAKAAFHFGQSAALGYKPARTALKELEYDFNLPPAE